MGENWLNQHYVMPKGMFPMVIVIYTLCGKSGKEELDVTVG